VAHHSSLLFYSFCRGRQHLNVNGPFGKPHRIDSHPENVCKHHPDIPSSTSVTVATLNISAMAYSTNEQITVTWTSVSTLCQDYFIAI
jgi:hypothetical protein